jgi:anti-sigma B factor antagonist
MEVATIAGDAHDAIVGGAACAREQAPSRAIPFSMGIVWPAQGLAVVVPQGEIDAFTAPRFKDAVAGCLSDGAGALVIDLSWVSFLDASGLAVAVYAARHLGARRTAIVCPFPHIVRVFRICGLERVLTICESREAALRSCLADQVAGLAVRSWEPAGPSSLTPTDGKLTNS